MRINVSARAPKRARLAHSPSSICPVHCRLGGAHALPGSEHFGEAPKRTREGACATRIGAFRRGRLKERAGRVRYPDRSVSAGAPKGARGAHALPGSERFGGGA